MNRIYNSKKLKNLRRDLRKSKTEAERIMWNYTQARRLGGHRFVRQYSVGKYILDFYCPKKRLASEIDGGHHNKHDNKSHDKLRTNYLESLNIKVIRYWNSQELSQTEDVLEDILNKLESD